MRTSPLRDALAAYSPTLVERHGIEVVDHVDDIETEYHHIRERIGVTDFSYMQTYRVPEETGIDFLENLVGGNVARVRFGRVAHTFVADDAGMIVIDCYVANNDDELVVMCESIVDDAAVDALFLSDEGKEAGVEKLTDSHVVIGVDGYRAWTVAKELFGPDVLGLPYLSLEMYEFDGNDVRLIRAGKTSEFGYLLMVAAEAGPKLLEACIAGAKASDGGLCGVAVHSELRLEGRFFNVFAEGARVGDPLQLGLQWMIDFDKGDYRGGEAIAGRRTAGQEHKVVGVQTAGELAIGQQIYDGDEQVGEVVARCHSYVLNADVGLAKLPMAIAFSGLEFSLGEAGGPLVSTISMPPIMPKSLTVKLDEM